ncbi:nucleotidyltransferase family protein [Acidicapsa ligni]|uniref:nucleotidyltransferase family protein n=1 Tax=Acidicapsa ligni TaxID=542300 RepID=UPI0021E013B1|nr:nucleotidyltransferase family protein [Acidicapsa ligni]
MTILHLRLDRVNGVPILNSNAMPVRLRREQRIREAVLLSFCDPLPEQCSLLRRLSGRDWRRLLYWLDTSGLALYFLDRMTELQLREVFPPAVLARLQENLVDNTERTQGMIDESNAIHREFQDAQFSYAILKGFSLWPHSVPKPWLRSQLDIDFLIAAKDAPQARQILESRGYHLHAISGRSWEFKTNFTPGGSLKDLYKTVPFRCVELHLEAANQGRPLLLERTENLDFHRVRVPVLSPADLFLGQGLHMYKHVCSEFSRTAHLIEFRRHVIARRDDDAFWSEVRLRAQDNPRASFSLGVVTLLITQVMGDFAPVAFSSWTVDTLPAFARLWVERYGHRTVLASVPGSKLYLLLLRELEVVGVPAKRSLIKALVPLALPPVIAHAPENETLTALIHRHHMQLRFVFSRLRFHAVEGLRYAYELRRWRRYTSEFEG